MSQLGIASRRAAEEMIENGRVRVNGKLAKLGDQADPETDTLEIDGRRIQLATPTKIYIAIHKPRNVVSTNVGHRTDDRQTVRELIPHKGHLFAIGRLDVDSEGLIVLTNDGALAQKLSHPRYQHTKTYKVVVQGLPHAEAIERWQRGLMLEEGTTGPASVRIVRGSTEFTTLRVVMTEGKKRQIRRIAQLLGHPVKRLVRTRIGMLELGTLKPGEWRELTPKDVEALATPSPEIKTIRQIASRRARFSPERPFDPEARSGRRARSGRNADEITPTRSGRMPRGYSTEDTAPGGYESDRKPMRRGPGKPSPVDRDAERPSRRPGDETAAERGSERRPRRSEPGAAADKPRGRRKPPTGRPAGKGGRPNTSGGPARRPTVKRGPKRSPKR